MRKNKCFSLFLGYNRKKNGYLTTFVVLIGALSNVKFVLRFEFVLGETMQTYYICYTENLNKYPLWEKSTTLL